MKRMTKKYLFPTEGDGCCLGVRRPDSFYVFPETHLAAYHKFADLCDPASQHEALV
jgi:hypothetical protein